MQKHIITILLVYVGVTACHDPEASITGPNLNQVRKIGRVTITESGRILSSAPTGFTETSRFTQHGTRNAKGGCRWRNSETLPVGKESHLYVAEYDPSTCEFVVARSTLPVGGGTASNAVFVSARLSRLAPAPAATAPETKPTAQRSNVRMPVPSLRMTVTPCNGGSGCSMYSYNAGSSGGTQYGYSFQDLYLLDPVDAMVNEDYNRVETWWDPQTYCFTLGKGNHGQYWYGPTGWRHGSYYNYFQEMSCLTATNITGSAYWNPSWCWPDEVDVEYYNRIERHNGYVEWDDEINLSGGGWCATLTPHVDRVS